MTVKITIAAAEHAHMTLSRTWNASKSRSCCLCTAYSYLRSSTGHFNVRVHHERWHSGIDLASVDHRHCSPWPDKSCSVKSQTILGLDITFAECTASHGRKAPEIPPPPSPFSLNLLLSNLLLEEDEEEEEEEEEEVWCVVLLKRHSSIVRVPGQYVLTSIDAIPSSSPLCGGGALIINQGGEGQGNTSKKSEATKSKGRGREEGASHGQRRRQWG